jgi:SH3 domain-containing YSC84-like protein 1
VALKTEQDRVENAGEVMKGILDTSDRIPQSVFDKADCVVVLPSVLKFRIGIGGGYGRGNARRDTLLLARRSQ